MAVESRRDLASRHGSIGRIAVAHSWSYRSGNPMCTRTLTGNVVKMRLPVVPVGKETAFQEEGRASAPGKLLAAFPLESVTLQGIFY